MFCLYWCSAPKCPGTDPEMASTCSKSAEIWGKSTGYRIDLFCEAIKSNWEQQARWDVAGDAWWKIFRILSSCVNSQTCLDDKLFTAKNLIFLIAYPTVNVGRYISVRWIWAMPLWFRGMASDVCNKLRKNLLTVIQFQKRSNLLLTKLLVKLLIIFSLQSFAFFWR